jgi:hypothetical protein
MSHLWIKDDTQGWSVLQLQQTAIALTAQGPQFIEDLAEARGFPKDILLMPIGGADGSWVLIASASTDVSVNGLPLVTGIRVLADQDEIRVSSLESYFYSTESLARVQAFHASEQTLFCPRCKQEITEGECAVRCPGCRVWHHETEDLNCWTYSEGCALCAHPTEISGTFRWTPEDL